MPFCWDDEEVPLQVSSNNNKAAFIEREYTS